MEFEFDLSDAILTQCKSLVIEGLSEVKPINKVSELSTEQKILINNALWYLIELNDEEMKQFLIINFGLKDIIADNLAYRHRQSYLDDPGFFTIFEKNSIESRNLKSVAMSERYEIRKKANKNKPIVIYR